MIRLIILTLGSILVISEALTNLDDGSLQSKFKYALGINRVTSFLNVENLVFW